MTTFLMLLAIIVVLVIVAYLALPAIQEWLRRREIVRRSAADQQMQAMRAAQQLSLLAWRARRHMHDIASQENRSRVKHPVRRK